MPSEKIIQLRQQIAERLPHLRLFSEGSAKKERVRLQIGLPGMDAALHGGLAKGVITELVAGKKNSGSALFIAALLRKAHETNQLVAFIDGSDSLDVTAFGPEILSRLLWIRCHNTTEALKATDILLRDRNLTLTILDLKLNPAHELKKIPGTTWYRFQRLIQQTSTVFLAITPRAMVASAEIRFGLESGFALEDVEREQLELFPRLASEILYERSLSERKTAGESA